MDKIYVIRGTEQSGPFTESEIRAQLASGALTGETMVWWEGLEEWTPISRTPLGAPVAAGIPIAPAPAAVTAVTAGSSAKKNSGLAITSLILGILGILCAPVIGLAAVITGHMARGQIRKDPSLDGSGMALAGLILGYFWIGLFIVGMIAEVVLVSLGNQVKDVFSTIQSQLNEAAMTNNAPASPDTASPAAPDTSSSTTNSAPASPDSGTNSSSTNSPTATPTNQ